MGLSAAGELRTAQNEAIAPDYSARRISWPREAPSARSAGVGRRSNSPQARQGSSLIALARGPTRRREDMVILMVTSSLVNAERNWTATP